MHETVLVHRLNERKTIGHENLLFETLSFRRFEDCTLSLTTHCGVLNVLKVRTTHPPLLKSLVHRMDEGVSSVGQTAFYDHTGKSRFLLTKDAPLLIFVMRNYSAILFKASRKFICF